MTETNNHIVVIGEALIDIVTRPNGEERVPGGSPLNVAVGLCKLNHPTILVTDYGDDADGALLTQHLGSAGVDVLRPVPPQPVTSTAHATIAADGSATYGFNMPWELTTETFNAVESTPSLVHTGSIGALLQPGSAAVETYFSTTPLGVARTFDPNIRAALLPDHAEAQAAVQHLAALSDVVKLSDEDAAWIFPGASEEAVARTLLTARTSLVAITRGSDPAILASELATVLIPAHRVDVIDTIGAGDAFMAGLIDAWLQATDTTLDAAALDRLGEHAALCAALTVQRAGAVPPTRSELARAAAIADTGRI
jgi:fructokinase